MAKAIYNEIDPWAGQHLRNLSRAGHITAGRVLTKSVVDLKPEDVKDATLAHFFAGIGIWDLALAWAGLPEDVVTWTGSCPCQDFSTAGKQSGFGGERDLWSAWRDLIDDRRPVLIFGEQVCNGLGRMWLDRTAADLEALGYAFGAVLLEAGITGAPHKRARTFFVAYSRGYRGPRQKQPDRLGERRPWWPRSQEDLQAIADRPFLSSHSHPQPLLRQMDDGYPRSVERHRAYGNAICPQVAAVFVKSALEVWHGIA